MSTEFQSGDYLLDGRGRCLRVLAIEADVADLLVVAHQHPDGRVAPLARQTSMKVAALAKFERVPAPGPLPSGPDFGRIDIYETDRRVVLDGHPMPTSARAPTAPKYKRLTDGTYQVTVTLHVGAVHFPEFGSTNDEETP